MNPSPKILIVDDEKEIRDVIRMMLDKQGYTFIEAGDGREALPLTLNTPFDLIITDIRMPKLDGLTLCKALRKNPDTQQIPILIVTSFSTPEPLREANLSGADDILPKPINPDELQMRVRSLLRLKQTTDELKRLKPSA